MTEPVRYPYSLKFSVATLAVMVLLVAIIFRSSWSDSTLFTRLVLGFCALIFLSLSTVMVTKRLWPALKGNVALQIDDEGICDFVKEISIEWKYVKDVRLIRGTSASIIRVDLNWETDHGGQIAIYLRWVGGRDEEIYETICAYFKHYSSDHNE